MVVVEPHAILGIGVREILDHEEDIDVVAYVATPAEALAVVNEMAPDVVFVDAPLAGAGAAEETRRLRRGAPESGFVIFGQDDDDASIVGAVEVGASAHVAAMAEPEELVETIRRVAGGEEPLRQEIGGRPDLVDGLLGDLRDSILADVEPPLITRRELAVLDLAAAGLSNREIADELGIRAQTVQNHLSAIYHKLGVPNRTRAVIYAIRQGLDQARPAS
jgi:DNA-binding NarL/FixJ family response regulator